MFFKSKQTTSLSFLIVSLFMSFSISSQASKDDLNDENNLPRVEKRTYRSNAENVLTLTLVAPYSETTTFLNISSLNCYFRDTLIMGYYFKKANITIELAYQGIFSDMDKQMIFYLGEEQIPFKLTDVHRGRGNDKYNDFMRCVNNYAICCDITDYKDYESPFEPAFNGRAAIQELSFKIDAVEKDIYYVLNGIKVEAKKYGVDNLTQLRTKLENGDLSSVEDKLLCATMQIKGHGGDRKQEMALDILVTIKDDENLDPRYRAYAYHQLHPFKAHNHNTLNELEKLKDDPFLSFNIRAGYTLQFSNMRTYIKNYESIRGMLSNLKNNQKYQGLPRSLRAQISASLTDMQFHGLDGCIDYFSARAIYEEGERKKLFCQLPQDMRVKSAKMNLAYMQYYGLGGDIDYFSARAIYEELPQKKLLMIAPPISLRLAKMQYYGLGGDIDYLSARAVFEQLGVPTLSPEEHTEVAYFLAVMRYLGQGGKVDKPSALSSFMRLKDDETLVPEYREEAKKYCKDHGLI